MAATVPGARHGERVTVTIVIVVMSQAWTLDAGPHLDGYVAAYEAFLELHREQPGFRGRQLLHSTDEPCHLVNLRFFDRAADYDALIARPGYAEHIAALGEHLDLERTPIKEMLDVVIDDGPAR